MGLLRHFFVDCQNRFQLHLPGPISLKPGTIQTAQRTKVYLTKHLRIKYIPTLLHGTRNRDF